MVGTLNQSKTGKAHVGGAHAMCMWGAHTMHTWGCMCIARVGGACAMHVWGVHMQCVHGGSLQLIRLCGGVTLQLISLCGGVILQLIRLVNANNLIGCGGDL